MSKKKSAKKSKAKVVETNEEVLENNELHLEFAEDETPESVEPGVEDATGEEFSEEALMATAEEAGADLEDSLIEDTEEEETLEAATNEEIEGSELESFESAEIEDVEHVTEEQIRSIVESVLFSTDKPISIALIKQAFKGTQVKSKDIREALTALSTEYIESSRGFTLDEIAGGFQLRTKPENMKYLRQSVKARPFKLSGPALEVLSIVAYKQPVTKAQIDEIRGVECGHLLRALMEKHLLTFGERSDLPGKPMYYETTRKFLEIFGLRNLQELPSLHEIDQLIPEGIGETEEKETLSDLTGQLSTEVTDKSYSVGEEELLKITDELSTITTSSDFFEQEKQRMREKRDADRAQDIRERITIEEQVDEKDRRWLERYEAGKMADAKGSEEIAFVTEGLEASAESASSDDVPNVVDATEEGTFDAEPSDDVPRDQEL